MRFSRCAGLLWLVVLGCTSSKPSFSLPPATHFNGVSGAGTTGSVDAGRALVAECDQAQDGTPCGAPGQPNHCIFNVCVRNACGDAVRAESEQCDDGNQHDHDGCDSRCRIEPPPSCGDGIVDPGEQCDDGNHDDTDACTHLCKYAVCGDSFVELGVEECDDGNPLNSDGCLNTCRLPHCGDGIVESGVEVCDDGNTNNNDACTDTCKSAVCGDGFVQTGVELCDNGRSGPSGTCDATCKPPAAVAPGPVCGDGHVDTGEQCDLGAGKDTTDGACPNCQNATCGDAFVGPGEECDLGAGNNTLSSACPNCKHATCGDGHVAPDEQCDLGAGLNLTTGTCPNCRNAACGDSFVGPGELCDDGNSSNTDACTTTCKNAVCGDGFVQAGVEQCDSGLPAGNGTCDSTCKVPAGVPVCDDGHVDTGEECDLGAGKNTPTSACPNCKNARCGDGLVRATVEQCDGTKGPSGPLGLGKSCSADCLTVVDDCLACEVANCTNYLGLGIDLIAGCYHNPDPTVVQKCVDAIGCARINNCAYTSRGAEQCFCGDATTSQCNQGTGVNGLCKAQFIAAANVPATTTGEAAVDSYVTVKFSDRSTPLGNAVFMLACDTASCPSTTPGNLCTP